MAIECDDSMARYYSEAQKRAAKKYHEANLYRFTVSIPKGQRDALIRFCLAYRGNDGMMPGSVNGTINLLLREAMGISAADWKTHE